VTPPTAKKVRPSLVKVVGSSPLPELAEDVGAAVAEAWLEAREDD